MRIKNEAHREKQHCSDEPGHHLGTRHLNLPVSRGCQSKVQFDQINIYLDQERGGITGELSRIVAGDGTGQKLVCVYFEDTHDKLFQCLKSRTAFAEEHPRAYRAGNVVAGFQNAVDRGNESR